MPERLEKQFGKRLRQLRKDQGLSQEQLAEMLEVDARTIRRWETGETGPEFNKLEAIAQSLGVPVSGLFVPKTPTFSPQFSENHRRFQQNQRTFQKMLEQHQHFKRILDEEW